MQEAHLEKSSFLTKNNFSSETIDQFVTRALDKVVCGTADNQEKQWYCEKLTWLFMPQQMPAELAKKQQFPRWKG